jgi:signal transduction histidine kinase/CheY-like chemotaxis protein
MEQPAIHLGVQLRLPLKPVIVVVVVLGAALILLSDVLAGGSEESQVAALGLCCYALAAVAWVLDERRPRLARWLTVLALLAGVHLAEGWLDVPGSLTLATVPVLLASLLVSQWAAIGIAAGESALLVVLLRQPASRLDLAAVAVALVAMWASLSIVHALCRPVGQLAQWSEQYYESAQCLMEEAQNRRAELDQTLQSLTYANRQLALLNEKVTSLRLIAEEAQQAKARFVARVSHEFRTPLNMIIGLVDLMVETPEVYDITLSPRMREALQVVHRNSQHLSDMVDDVLDLARMEADRVVLHREQVDIGELVESAVEVVGPLLESKHLELRLALPERAPKVYCDRTRVQQVVLNLMSNAARFTDKGEVTVAVTLADHHVRVSVKDTGRGIAPEDVERIFEPFCQGTHDLWRDTGGSGLGLTISKRFVELHGGRMWVESELGAGTVFTFELPQSPPVGPIGPPGHRISEEWLWREHQPRPTFPDAHYRPRFVICDESGDLSSTLADYSDQVEFVDTPSVEAAALQSSAAHAVLLNAASLAEAGPLVELATRRSPGIPIIAGSIRPRSGRGLAGGALGHLVKPVGRPDLAKAIQSAGRPVGHVLIVDDDPDALELFSNMLHACDRTLMITTASRGEEALAELRRRPPDLMLLDIVMPGIDGWQVLEAMAVDPQIPKVPTFLLSAQDPSAEPPRSTFLLASMNEGVPVSRFLRCALAISKQLLRPEGELGPMPL